MPLWASCSVSPPATLSGRGAAAADQRLTAISGERRLNLVKFRAGCPVGHTCPARGNGDHPPSALLDRELARFGAEMLLGVVAGRRGGLEALVRSEEHTSELQSLMRNSYAVFCLKKN